MLLLENSLLQNFALLVGSDVFFLLHPMEEEEGEDRDSCCTPDVQEFSYQGTSVFMMGSWRKVSLCDETRLSRRISRAPAPIWFVRLVFDHIGPG